MTDPAKDAERLAELQQHFAECEADDVKDDDICFLFELSWADEDPGTCARCGEPWEWVRPGKSQPSCDCYLQPVSDEALAAERAKVDATMDAIFGPLPAPDDVERAQEADIDMALAITAEIIALGKAGKAGEAWPIAYKALTAARREGAEAAYARYLQDHLDLVKVMYREREEKVAEARREGAELRALDEAVIEWARAAVTAMDARAGYSLAHNELRKALAARDAAIGALAARPRDAAPAEESDGV